VQVEMIGQEFTECTGGAPPITDEALSDRYHTHYNPRHLAEPGARVPDRRGARGGAASLRVAAQ
jgi:hypothetical protein